MLNDYFFWFSQPSSILNNYDKLFFYLFAGMFALGLVLWLTAWLTKHPVLKKLTNKFRRLLIWVGIIGLIWFGFRYENTPIFSKRIWAALVLVMGLVWLGFVLKYFISKFGDEKSEFDSNLIKSKYLPKQR